jgi:predicted metalloendopeptidase
MMRKIIYTNLNGRLCIVHPIRNTIGETLATDAEIEQRAWDRLPAEAINPQWVDESAIPFDRTFRNAWKANGSKIEHDMAKCREITKDRLRAERAPLLAAQDVAYQRALEASADTSAIVAEKQRLRDVTQLADAATSLDELKALKV